MPDINEARRRFRLVLAILLAFCMGAAGVLLSPIGRTRHRQLEELQAELQAKSIANVPLQGIDRKLVDAQGEIANFYRDRLPSSYASISERLGAIASETGVSLTTGQYRAVPSGAPGLEHLLISASITGDYLHAVKFINATERESMFFVVDGVSLTQQQGSTVQLQIRIEAFRKEA
jgi:Tfp pilus assembly protein PilO